MQAKEVLPWGTSWVSSCYLRIAVHVSRLFSKRYVHGVVSRLVQASPASPIGITLGSRWAGRIYFVHDRCDRLELGCLSAKVLRHIVHGDRIKLDRVILN